jgi:hypothetical protein
MSGLYLETVALTGLYPLPVDLYQIAVKRDQFRIYLIDQFL